MIAFLFRSEEPAYATALARTGAAARFRPVLNTALNASAVPLDLADRYSAVVFTSGKAVEAVAAVKGLAWPSIACFVVGKATAAKARTLLAVTEVQGEQSGSASELAAVIVEKHRQKPFGKPLLFLCGETRLDILPTMLGEAHIAFEELVVYESRIEPAWVRSAVDEVVEECDKRGQEEKAGVALVLFSPSGAQAVLSALAVAWEERQRVEEGESDRERRRAAAVHIVAFGASTDSAVSAALEQLGIGQKSADGAAEESVRVLVVASRSVCAAPTAEAVADALSRIGDVR